MSETETVTEAETPAPIAAQTANQPIDLALLEKLADLKTMVKLSQILANGIFPGGMATDIMICQEWLKNKHEPLFKEAQEHPDFKRAHPQAQPPTPADEVAIEKAEVKRAKKAAKKKGH